MSETATLDTESEILEQVIEPGSAGMSPETAQALLRFRFNSAAAARMNELAEKNRQGTIALSERALLERVFEFTKPMKNGTTPFGFQPRNERSRTDVPHGTKEISHGSDGRSNGKSFAPFCHRVLVAVRPKRSAVVRSSTRSSTLCGVVVLGGCFRVNFPIRTRTARCSCFDSWINCARILADSRSSLPTVPMREKVCRPK